MLLEQLKMETKSARVRKSINYVYDLCAENKINPAEIDVDKVFEGEFGEIPVQELNKMFFSHVRQRTRHLRRQISEESLAALGVAGKWFRSSEANQLAGLINARSSEIDSYQDSITNKMKEIRKLRDQMEGMKPGINLEKIVNDVVASGFWELTWVSPQDPGSGHLVRFKSGNCVISQEKDDGRDFKMDFGRLIFGLHTSGEVSALTWNDQPDAAVLYGGYFYPFIRSDGKICWGSGASAAASMIASKNFEDLFILLERLLTSYDGGSPYTSLSNFFVMGRNRKQHQPWLRKLNPKQLKLYGLTPQGIGIEPHKENGSWNPYVCDTRGETDGCGYMFTRIKDQNTCPSCGGKLFL